MAKLILPAHARGMTEEAELAMKARMAAVVEFKVIMPESGQVVTITPDSPVPIEGVAMAMVQGVYQFLKQRQGEEVADRILNVN